MESSNICQPVENVKDLNEVLWVKTMFLFNFHGKTYHLYLLKKKTKGNHANIMRIF